MSDSRYDERIEGAQEAIKRAPTVFLILTIVSLSILITAWNAYFSWDREMALGLSEWAKNDAVTQLAQQRLVEGWVKNQTIDVSLLGIHISVSDIAPLGGLALFILSIWFFFSARRENHTIALLLRDTKNESDDVRTTIFHSVVSYLVFLTIRPTDDPIDDLEEKAATRGHMVALRAVVGILFFLPSFCILAAIACDALSIFVFPAPFREGHQPLAKAVDISFGQWALWGGIEGFALALAFGTFFLSWRALKFESATGRILKQYCDGIACCADA
jgi:hypothetical protein